MSNVPANTTCPICAGLKNVETAYQKYGWEENNTYLPAEASRLTLLRDFRPESSRKLQLLQCPACGACYLYQTDYEYLVNGSEDEERLVRLTPEQAEKYLI